MGASSTDSLLASSTPETPRTSGDRRLTPDRRRSMPSRGDVEMGQGSHASFFGALDACGINGETARIVCGERDKPIDSGTWSRLRKGDPTDAKTPRLLAVHIDRAVAEFGPAFRSEYQRRWSAAHGQEAIATNDALLLEAVAAVNAVLQIVRARATHADSEWVA